MNIVPMNERHLSALAAIEQACFAAPWSEQMLREELGGRLFRVAEIGGEAVGYVGCQTVLDEGYITNVAVRPEMRRQGIARALLSALEADARQAGLTFITLEVRLSNAPAIALYEGAGYRAVGTRPRFYHAPVEDALLMTLFLREDAP